MKHKIGNLYKKIWFPWIYSRRKMRKRIQNKNFTIITPNCMGGLIYHDLGMRFLSPTINLQIFPYDRFLLNMKYYFEQELVFLDSNMGFPVATLGGDITIWFTHYKTNEEAQSKWYERIKRINWENLYVLGSDIEIDTTEKIKEVIQKVECKKIKIFTSKNYSLKGTIYIKKYKNKKCVGNLLAINFISGKRRYEEALDIVEWLNEE